MYVYRIELWETSNLFRAGHCIRLEVSSSNFPRFDRNLNTGHPHGLDDEMQVAQQRIYHDRAPSIPPDPAGHTAPMIRIGADVGGTFTDVVALDDRGGIWTHKVPSTPPHFERAVLSALDQLIPRFSAPDRTVSEVAHGTTVATNAVLEHRGARTALITTRGFRDVLELRRVRAPQLYDLFFDKPRPLVERRLRLEVDEAGGG